MIGFLLGVFTTIALLVLAVGLFYAIKIRPILKKAKDMMKELQEPDIPLQKIDYNLKLKSIDGWNFDFNSCKNKIVFLNFWATWCAPCLAEMPSLQNLYNNFKDNTEIIFLFVSKDENQEKVRKLLKDRNYSMPIYFVDGELPGELNLKAIPATFILNRDGRIIFSHLGAAKWDSLLVIDFLASIIHPLNSISKNFP